MTELNNPCRSNRLAKISIAFIMATAILISLPWSPKLVAQSQVSSETVKTKHEEPPKIELDDHNVVLRLIDETDSSSIADAKVVATVDDHTETFTTNNQGFVRVAFDPVKNDRIQFRIVKDGYVPKFQIWMRDESDEFPPARQITWKIQKGMKVSGLVLDSSGLPVSDALVRIYYSVKEFPTSTIPELSLETIVSDLKGRWTTSQIPPEAKQISVSVSHKQFLTDPIPSPFYPPFETLKSGAAKVAMSPGAIITGRVTANGQPLEDVKVYRNKYTPHEDIMPLAVTTDKNGDFKLAGLYPQASLVLAMHKPGFATLIKSVRMSELGQAQTFEMQPGKTVRGIVRDNQGRALPGVGLIPFHLNRQQILLDWKTKTDDNGEFEITDLGMDPVEYLLIKPGYFTVPLKLDAAENKPVEITMIQSPIVKGTVKDKLTGQFIEDFIGDGVIGLADATKASGIG